jgi:hypothetical protein
MESIENTLSNPSVGHTHLYAPRFMKYYMTSLHGESPVIQHAFPVMQHAKPGTLSDKAELDETYQCIICWLILLVMFHQQLMST